MKIVTSDTNDVLWSSVVMYVVIRLPRKTSTRSTVDDSMIKGKRLFWVSESWVSSFTDQGNSGSDLQRRESKKSC